MEKVTSADGTTIAFDQLGAGPPLILVSGASVDRSIDAALATALAAHFTVLNYDRRGRATARTPFRSPSNVRSRTSTRYRRRRRLGHGGRAVVAGAALAAEAALRGVPIDTFVRWEPPFSVDDGQRRFEDYADRLRALADGRKADALAHFALRSASGRHDRRMRQSPYWRSASAWSGRWLRHRGAGRLDGPHGAVRLIEVPTLVLAGRRAPSSSAPRPPWSQPRPASPRGPARPGPQRRRRAHPGRCPVQGGGSRS